MVKKLWPVVAQVVGGAATVVGVGLLLGVAVAVLCGGLGLLVVGILREAGRI